MHLQPKLQRFSFMHFACLRYQNLMITMFIRKKKMSVFEANFCLFFLLSLFSRTAFPAAFVAPITKDSATQKYLLSVYLKTPPHPTNLLLDLDASFTLLDCTTSSGSCTVRAGSDHRNSVTQKSPVISQPANDSLSLHLTDGRNPGELATIPEFVYSCGNRSSIKGLVKTAAGSAGLGRSNLSIPAQVSGSSARNSTFALCLSGSPSAPGVAFFGSSGPYFFIPEDDLSKHLNYTPLLSNPIGSTVLSYSDPSSEYFIGLTSIKVNGKELDFNRTVLTKLSTVTPYTTLHTTIYDALTEAFANESAKLNLTVTEAVKPFKLCYHADDVASTHVGPGFPTVDLVLRHHDSDEDDEVVWRIYGSNSMVRIYRDDLDVWCLGFIDGGTKPSSSVVIGGHQMENNLLQFDLEMKKLGFSTSILAYGTTCGNFNFTTSNSSLIYG